MGSLFPDRVMKRALVSNGLPDEIALSFSWLNNACISIRYEIKYNGRVRPIFSALSHFISKFLNGGMHGREVNRWKSRKDCSSYAQ